jgi:uncharacterized membrane protein
MYFISISIVIICNVLYTLFQDAIPNGINPAVAILCMNIGGLLFALPFYFANKKNNYKTNKNVFKYAILLGITGIISDLGFLLAFKSGWEIGYFNVITNVIILISFTMIGAVFFKEKLSLTNIIGIFIGIIGIAILNF